MPSAKYLFRPDANNRRPVHPQGGNRGSTRRGSSDYFNSIPPKVIVPKLLPRMIQGCRALALGIDGDLACFLAQRTGHARQGEIRLVGRSASSARHNVIDMKACFLAVLRQLAVLATALGTADDEAPQARADRSHPLRFRRFCGRSARMRSHENVSARLTSPSASARSAFVSNAPESCLSKRSCRRELTPGGSRNRERSFGSSRRMVIVDMSQL